MKRGLSHATGYRRRSGRPVGRLVLWRESEKCTEGLRSVWLKLRPAGTNEENENEGHVSDPHPHPKSSGRRQVERTTHLQRPFRKKEGWHRGGQNPTFRGQSHEPRGLSLAVKV